MLEVGGREFSAAESSSRVPTSTRSRKQTSSCDPSTVTSRSQAVMDVCCPSTGGGHRRTQGTTCSLPTTCPSIPCADEFTSFVLHPLLPQLVSASRARQLRHHALDVDAGKVESLRMWKAHKMPVLDLAYEGTGTLVASASADSAVMVFDVEKGFCTHVFRGHEGVVHRVTFHPDAARCASHQA